VYLARIYAEEKGAGSEEEGDCGGELHFEGGVLKSELERVIELLKSSDEDAEDEDAEDEDAEDEDADDVRLNDENHHLYTHRQEVIHPIGID
jgi:hypothetical protein